jgi:cytochrome-b5 reductase
MNANEATGAISGANSSPIFFILPIVGSVLLVLYLFVSKREKKLLPLDDFVEVPLIDKQELSHDTRRFTFALPSNDMLLGLPIGQHLTLQFKDDKTGKVVQRSYTPVTDETTEGKFSLVVKVYHPLPPKFPDGGAMSQHLDRLQIGDTVRVKGPKGHLTYLHYGNFSYKPLGKPQQERGCSNLCMIAGGTGITPMLQILHAVFVTHPSKNESLTVQLLYANQTPGDILVRDELEALASQYGDRLKIWYTVDRDAPSDWKYSTGFITKSMIEEHFQLTKTTQFFSKSHSLFSRWQCPMQYVCRWLILSLSCLFYRQCVVLQQCYCLRVFLL